MADSDKVQEQQATAQSAKIEAENAGENDAADQQDTSPPKQVIGKLSKTEWKKIQKSKAGRSVWFNFDFDIFLLAIRRSNDFSSELQVRNHERYVRVWER